MNRSWRVGRIGGVDIRVDLSFFVVAFLLVSYQWTAFSDRSLHPGNGTTEALALSLMVAAVFFGSVLAHEYAHAVMYRVLGIDVAAITLWMFGGFTQAKRAAPTWLAMDRACVGVGSRAKRHAWGVQPSRSRCRLMATPWPPRAHTPAGTVGVPP